MANWKPGVNAPLGVANGVPTTADTTALVPVGTIREFYDDTQGFAEFIYLPGVAALVAGDVVTYDLSPGAQAVTRLADNTQNNTGRPVAFATAAVPAGSFGWYQITGVAIVNAVAGVVAGVMMLTVTVGSVGNTADAGDHVLSARISSAVGTPAAGKAYATICRPFIQGQIT